MKVKELIKELDKLDPEAEVIVTSSNFELGGAYISAQYVTQFNGGLKEVRTFRDAFDNETYETEVCSCFGGNEPVITIG